MKKTLLILGGLGLIAAALAMCNPLSDYRADCTLDGKDTFVFSKVRKDGDKRINVVSVRKGRSSASMVTHQKNLGYTRDRLEAVNVCNNS